MPSSNGSHRSPGDPGPGPDDPVERPDPAPADHADPPEPGPDGGIDTGLDHGGGRWGPWPRRILVGLGVVALLLAGAAITAKMIFTPEKLASMVMPRLEEATGRDVQVSAVRLKILPRPAVRVEDFALGAAPGFGPEPAATAEAIDAEIAVWPLFRGQVSVKRLRLVAPTLRYLVAPDGTPSFGGMDPDAAEDAPGAGAEGAARLFPASEFTVERGTVLYDDRQAGRGARFRVDGDFSASLEDRVPVAISSRGDLRIGSLRAMLPALRDDSLRVETFRLVYDGTLHTDADSLDFRSLEVDLDGVRLSGDGSLAMAGERPRADFRFETGETDIEELRRLAPRLDFGGLEPRGQVRASVRVRGELGGDDPLRIDGTGRLEALALAGPGDDEVVSGMGADLAFGGNSVRASALEGSLLGRTVRGEVTLLRGDPPRVRGRLAGEVDLERFSRMRIRLAEAADVPDADIPRPMSGTADVELAFRGPLGDGLSGLTFQGPMRLSGFGYETPALANPLRIPSGTLRLTGTGLEARDITLRVGDVALTLTADARNLLPLSRLDREGSGAGPRPLVEFRLESDRVQLDQILPGPEEGDTGPTYSQVLKAHLSGEQVGGRRPDEIAGDRFPLPGLPTFDARGEVRVGELVNPPTRMEELAFRVDLGRGLLRVEEIRSGLYGGRLTGRVSAERGDDDRRSTVRYVMDLQGSDAAAFMDRWTKLEDALTGTLDISIDGRTFFDRTLLPVTDRSDAEGRLTVRDGSMEGMLPMQGVVRAIGASRDQIARFDSLGGPFRVREGRLELLDWRLYSRSGADGRMAGTVDFAGPLDLDMTLSVPLSMLQGSPLLNLTGGGQGLLSRLLGGAAGEDDIIDVPLTVRGTMSDPAVTVDERVFAKELQKLLQQKGVGSDLLRNLFGGEEEEEEGGGGLLDRLLKGAKKDTTGGGGG